MPITPPTALPALLGQLGATGSTGFGLPRFASGVVAGLMLWVPQVTGTATTVGTLAAGIATASLVVPTPTLFGALTQAFVGEGIIGLMAPQLIAGLASGLSLVFAQGLVVAPIPTTGIGTGIIRFNPIPAGPSMVQGFASVGMSLPDSAKMATAIGTALTTTFTALVLPAVVVGAPNIISGSGLGVAKIV